jgi:hypothetical protein
MADNKLSFPPVLRYAAFAVLILGSSSYYSQTYVVGRQSTRVELFSLLAIPLVTLLANLVLVSLLPFRWYVATVALDYLVLLAIATSCDYYGDNLDVHLILQNWREGLPFAGYVFELIPKSLMLVAALAAGIRCYLARGLTDSKVNRSLVVGLALLLTPAYAYALRKEPIQRAGLNQDYALCIKLYGYYGAMIADLVVTGVVPSQDELLKGFLAVQARGGSADPGWCVADSHSRSVLALQVESLDYNVIDVTWEGRPVAPFLHSLKANSLFLRLSPAYSEASSSSGADFQVLTGMLPPPSFPVYGINGIDYSQALPHLFERAGVESFAFVGVTSNFFSQGAGFRQAGFKKHFDQSAYPKTDARWGVDDKNFLEFNARFLNQRSARSFYLMITVSSHGPFDYVEHRAFEGDELAVKYMNSINYVDEQLGRFLRGLRGQYLVLVYGDHSAGLRTPEYSSESRGGTFVPGFVFLLDDGVVHQPRVIGEVPAETELGAPLRSLYWVVKRSGMEGCPLPPAE